MTPEAISHHSAGRYEAAEVAWLEAADNGSGRPESLFGAAHAAYKQGAFKRAFAYCKEAYSLKPTFQEAACLRFFLAMRLRGADCVDELNAILETPSVSVDSLCFAGLCLLELGDRDNATSLLETAYKREPIARVELAVADLYTLTRPSGAMKLYRQAREHCPLHGRVLLRWLRHCLCQNETPHLGELVSFTNCVLMPEDYRARVKALLSEDLRANHNEWVAQVDQCLPFLGLDPIEEHFYRWLEQALAQTGQAELRLTLLEALLEWEPWAWDWHAARRALLVSLGRTAEAAANLQEQIAAFLPVPQYRFTRNPEELRSLADFVAKDASIVEIYTRGNNIVGSDTQLVSHPGTVRIGFRTTFGGWCKVSSHVDIGNYSQFGVRISVISDSHRIDHLASYSNHRLNPSLLNQEPNLGEPLQIGHDVWVGDNATILSRANVGNGAVIGAGAVVTKEVPPYAIVGGNPAKILRYRFSEAVIERLQRLCWWDFSLDQLVVFAELQPLLCGSLTEDETAAIKQLDHCLLLLGR